MRENLRPFKWEYVPKELIQKEKEKEEKLYLTKPDEGDRNNTLASYTGKILNEVKDVEKAKEKVKIWNASLANPLPPREVATTFKSIVKKEKRTRKNVAEIGDDFSDMGNAERFFKFIEGKILRISDEGKYYVFQDGRWVIDDDETKLKACWEQMVKQLETLTKNIDDDKQREYILKEVNKLKSANKRSGAFQFLIGKTGFSRSSNEMGYDDYYLNCRNGIVEMQNGIHRESHPADLQVKQTNVDFVQGASSPNWLRFLEQITEGDKEYQRYLQKVVGYSATNDVNYNSVFFLFGKGANGKSTFLEVIYEILGDYATSVDLNVILSDKCDNNIQYQNYELKGARLAIAAETDETKKLSEGVIKKLSGGDTIIGRPPYGRPVKFQPSHKLWIHGNHKPLIYGDDYGIWRRIKFLPFNRTFTDDQIDLDLKQKLLAEREGILNWILEGVQHWLREKNLAEPEIVRNAINAYRKESDQIGRFIEEVFGKGQTELGSVREVRQKYLNWLDDSCEVEIRQRAFNNRMRSIGFEQKSKRINDSVAKFWTRKDGE